MAMIVNVVRSTAAQFSRYCGVPCGMAATCGDNGIQRISSRIPARNPIYGGACTRKPFPAKSERPSTPLDCLRRAFTCRTMIRTGMAWDYRA